MLVFIAAAAAAHVSAAGALVGPAAAAVAATNAAAPLAGTGRLVGAGAFMVTLVLPSASTWPSQEDATHDGSLTTSGRFCVPVTPA